VSPFAFERVMAKGVANAAQVVISTASRSGTSHVMAHSTVHANAFSVEGVTWWSVEGRVLGAARW
jgi:hypothetical protein